MYLSSDISSALQIVEDIKQSLKCFDIKSQTMIHNDLNRLILLLDNPIIRTIVNVQDSLTDLNKQLIQHPSILPLDFDISPSGELIMNLSNVLTHSMDFSEMSGFDDPSVSNRLDLKPSIEKDSFDSLLRNQSNKSNSVDEISYRTTSLVSDTSKSESDSIFHSKWAEIEVINLVNDGTGLGFGIIGGKSIGVIVKTILEDGVAYRDSRLRSGDYILQIGDVNLYEMSSEQVASVLRQSGSHVRLVVVRPANPLSNSFQTKGTTYFVPSKLLYKPIELNMYMRSQGYGDVFNKSIETKSDSEKIQRKMSTGSKKSINYLTQSPETEILFVELKKNQKGLGITIAGYVCEKEALSGIFVKSITKGSAADLSGKIKINDRIIQVDNIPLQDCSNNEAVEILRNSGNTVVLCLERYLYGPKYEQLQQQDFFEENNEHFLLEHGLKGDNQRNPETDTNKSVVYCHDVPSLPIKNNYDLEKHLIIDNESQIIEKWKRVLNDNTVEIIIAHIQKFNESSGLGISLEGTVDVEFGKEVRPHHYIRSILPKGPVGLNNKLRPHDELLEVNNKRLLGLNHLEVVSILKELPLNVTMVCGRHQHSKLVSLDDDDDDDSSSEDKSLNITKLQLMDEKKVLFQNNNIQPVYDRLVKAKSDGSLATSVGLLDNETFSKMRSRSLEPLTGLAMWSSEIQVIELIKSERGLGFSILDYQDPIDPNNTVIVIRSLVPGGVAQIDGRLIPGDRLIFVNDTNLENATLDQAVQVLKGAIKGIVRIGVAKPLPLSDNVHFYRDDFIYKPNSPIDLSQLSND